MLIKDLSRIALLLAVALTAGCHKSTSDAEKPPAATPSTDQAQSSAATTPATPSNPSGSTASPAASQPAAAGSAAPAGTATTPTPDQPVTPQEQATNASAPALPEVPAGTILSIRMSQTINVKHAEAGQPFTGTITNPIVVDGNTVIPSGAGAEGVVVQAHKRGHFKGSSYLQLTLTGLNIHGQHYRIDTSSVTRTKKGKGKRSAGVHRRRHGTRNADRGRGNGRSGSAGGGTGGRGCGDWRCRLYRQQGRDHPGGIGGQLQAGSADSSTSVALGQ